MADAVIKIYSRVCECNSERCLSFPEIYNNAEMGSPPRGFYTESPGPVDALVVGKNPGHVLDSEARLYKGLSGEPLVKAHLNFSKETFFKKNELNAKEKQSTRFHSNLISYISEILDIQDESVFKRVAYTNLVKCSTTDDEQARLTLRSMDECFARHLSSEVEFFKPKIIFSLGREVERYLKRSHLNGKYQIAYIKHPSYNYKKERRSDEISSLRRRFLECSQSNRGFKNDT